MKKKHMTFLVWTLIALFALSAVLAAGCKPKNVYEAIKKNGVIVVGTSPDYPPYENKDANNNYVGFDVDLMTEIAKRLGVTLEWKDFDFKLLLAGLEAGKIDAIISCMDVNAERQAQASFTNTYLVSPEAVLIKKGAGITLADLSGLAQHRVGVQDGTTQQTYVADNLVATGKMSEANVSSYPKVDMAITDLINGRVDCVFIDEAPANAFVQDGKVEKILTVTLPGDPAIAVKLGETELVAKLNEIIKALQDEGFITQTVSKYPELSGN